MRHLAGLMLLAALAGASHGQIRIAGETKVAPYVQVRLNVDGVTAKSGVIWRVSPNKAVSKASLADKTRLEFVAPPGEYAVEALAVTLSKDGTTDIQESQVTVTIGTPTPVPPPGPTPGPAPGPGPTPTPVPGGMRVLITYESADLSKLPAGQAAVLFSAKVREYLNAKCPDDAGWKAWRIYDKDTDVRGESKLWQDLMARGQKSQPWIVISDGAKAVHEGPLPGGVEEAMLLLKSYGG